MATSQLFVILILVIFSAIFSLIEASFLSVSAIKVNALKREKRSGSDALFYLKQNPKRLIVTTLLGNTVVNFTAVTVATIFALDYLDDGAVIATVIMTLVVLIFGQIIPKVIAEQNAVPLALFFSRPMMVFMKLLWPIVALFDKLAEVVSRQFKSKDSISDDEFKMMILHSKQDGVLSRDSATLMNKILDFQETPVNKLMTPKKLVFVVDGSQKLSKVIDAILKTGYHHIPVYEKSKDHVVGVVSVDTLIKALREKKSTKAIKTFATEHFVIPETKKIEDLVPDLVNERMAIIVNEYGYFVGVITLPDILGALFTKEPKTETAKRGIVSGKATLAEINTMFGIKLESESVNTIAGYIESEIQRIPKTGEKLQVKSLNVEIVKATKQEIKEIKITR
ncbi:MAG: HlyC/CorC family transporter [Nanoarchaeota archaeon]|nr:HlyC/CorC family transporter [Nanoarchaeota archaeon]